MVFLAYAVVSNSDLWLVLIHTQSLRDLVTVIDAVRVVATFLACWVGALSLRALLEDTLAIIQDCRLEPLGCTNGFSQFPSGKRLQIAMENHHAVHGKTHHFYGNFQ